MRFQLFSHGPFPENNNQFCLLEGVILKLEEERPPPPPPPPPPERSPGTYEPGKSVPDPVRIPPPPPPPDNQD